MRVSQQEMDASHARIVRGTAQLMRERGLLATSVADAMQAAGLTHGGFYRHFGTKDALLAEALASAFEQFLGGLEGAMQAGPAGEALDAFRSLYLSQLHVDHPGEGCPVPALGAEVARQPEALREVFGAGVRRVVDLLAQDQPGPQQVQRAAALREFAMLAGAVTLARACDAATSAAVLAACRGEGVGEEVSA